MNQPFNSHDSGYHSTDRDGEDDGHPRESLCSSGPKQERDPYRERRQRVADIVRQVGKKGDAAADRVHADLRHSRRPEDRQRLSHRA
jgi:hypothetical protein